MRKSVGKVLMIAGTMLVALPALAQTAAPPAANEPSKASTAPADAHVYLISPANGAVLKSPFVVQFGLRGMGVTQAGSAAPNAGHHHLLVDVNEPINPGETIPSDKNHLHFGAGQTETKLDLPPGRHTLQLVLGDAKHLPFSPLLASQKITVTVVTKLPSHKRKRRAH